jgi:ABC-2 type transport system permease protein
MNALHVIKREYLEAVRTKSFIISTILVPLLMMTFLLVPLLLTLFVSGSQITLSVIDRTGEIAPGFVASLDDTLKDGRRQFVLDQVITESADFDGGLDALVAKLNDKTIDVVVEVPADVFTTGKAYYITKDQRSLRVIEKFEESLGDIVLKRRLAREGLDYDRVAALTKGVDLEVRRTTRSGTTEERSFLGEWGLVFIFVMILYVSLLGYGVTIQRSVIEEKSSRVIEVLLSSLSARDLFIGKIFGVGLVGLTQMVIWSVAGLAVGTYSYFAAAQVFQYINVPPMVLVFFVLYFVLGFLLYSSIFTIIGAMCSTEQDAQHLQGLVTLPMIVPLLVLILIIQSPNGPFAVVLSLIPLFTPMLMMARVVVQQPEPWQILLSIAIMLLSIFGTIVFAARVFRVGILMYGKRPNIREIIRWFRYA